MLRGQIREENGQTGFRRNHPNFRRRVITMSLWPLLRNTYPQQRDNKDEYAEWFLQGWRVNRHDRVLISLGDCKGSAV